MKDYMSALISDLTLGRIAPNVANAACNAAGKLLRVVELEHRFGNPKGRGGAVAALVLASAR